MSIYTQIFFFLKYNVSVWIEMIVAFSKFHALLFFSHVNSNLTWVYCARYKNHYLRTVYHCLCTIHALKNIKNEPHGTIYTFKNKNYFVTVLSVFSFQFSVSATINSIQTNPMCYFLFYLIRTL